MKLRITTGTKTPALPPATGMVMLHRGNGLVIEATPDVRAVQHGDARLAFVGGDVVADHPDDRAGKTHRRRQCQQEDLGAKAHVG